MNFDTHDMRKNIVLLQIHILSNFKLQEDEMQKKILFFISMNDLIWE